MAESHQGRRLYTVKATQKIKMLVLTGWYDSQTNVFFLINNGDHKCKMVGISILILRRNYINLKDLELGRHVGNHP